MKATVRGRQSEAAVVAELKRRGCRILSQNWRTRYCEIDIVAEKNRIVYFVEVKYRSRAEQGSGLDYILPRKLKQLHFAARMWLQQYDWNGDYRLMAASVGGDNVVEKVVELD